MSEILKYIDSDYSVHVEPLNPTQRATRSDVESHPFSWGIPL